MFGLKTNQAALSLSSAYSVGPSNPPTPSPPHPISQYADWPPTVTITILILLHTSILCPSGGALISTLLCTLPCFRVGVLPKCSTLLRLARGVFTNAALTTSRLLFQHHKSRTDLGDPRRSLAVIQRSEVIRSPLLHQMSCLFLSRCSFGSLTPPKKVISNGFIHQWLISSNRP